MYIVLNNLKGENVKVKLKEILVKEVKKRNLVTLKEIKYISKRV